MRSFFGKFIKILGYYALIPFLASLPAGILNLLGVHPYADVVIVPVLTAAIYVLFRHKMDNAAAAKVNGIAILVLLAIFTVMMWITSGNVEGGLMTGFSWLIFPFAPVILIFILMGQNMLLFVTALLAYVTAFGVTAFLAKIRIRKVLIPAAFAVVCIAASSALYVNRSSVKYAGHGFEYMHGYSSTDFSDYMVYSDPSKLVTLDHQPNLLIEKEEDMPILDGAEACYPLYAAFAKAVYKDIGAIEKARLEEPGENRFNGKIVTFTNSVHGFDRLVLKSEDATKYGSGIDMFFGARPSASQLEFAKEEGVELEITPIGREAFVFFVEEDNPVSDLTSDQIKAIYHGDITNWSELGGKDQEIMAFQRPQNSGSQTMMQYFMGDISLKEPKTYEKVDAMSGVIKEVAQYANEKGAMGYTFRYFLEELNQEKGVKMLSVDGVYPSLDNIENGSYPLTTNVCLITRKNETNPYVQKMTEFILSEDGQDIIRRTGYAPLAAPASH